MKQLQPTFSYRKEKDRLNDAADSLAADLRSRGWGAVSLNLPSARFLPRALHSIATLLGKPVAGRNGQVLEELRPVSQTAARFPSLSRQFGYGQFPLHCDTAHWITPCRTVLLACVRPGVSPAATVLLDLQSVSLSAMERKLIASEVFLIRNGRRSFYGSISSPNQKFVRVDPGCMIPVSENAAEALRIFSHERNGEHLKAIDWAPGLVIAVDNWRVLHSRTAARQVSEDRLLMRAMIE